MISFDLQCEHGHQFEGWFGSSADYDTQKQKSLVDCPICGSFEIQKCLTAPHVGRKGNQTSGPARVPNEVSEGAMASLSNSTELPDQIKEVIEKMAKIQADSLKDSKWVGRQFAEEARAIHYGEAEAHIIHGETSPVEAKQLAEEGVPVAPLLFPFIPPEAKN